MSDEWDKAEAAVRSLGSTRKVEELTASDLRAWASENTLMTRTQWPKVKRELYKQFDVDYDALREREQRERAQALAAAAADAPVVGLWSAGDDRGSFAVVGDAGTSEVAWYGSFHQDDRIFRQGDQDSADEASAGKAVFLAAKVREHLDATAVRLRLRVSSERIDGVKLADLAAKKQVILDLEVVQTANPAEQWCLEPGFGEWRAIRLSDLVVAE
ncbi:hypothetical protein G352_26292 [Rhodococcus ruber BKS 20-38]|uniref:Uncharacterized protein n=1 Tax=Rhodococcus ruber BKS 20-38 TaxID=1278076 RepID=M2Y8P8_9NOCA|nr:hypothetical protein G352_26292 [Rhodococcus ruber BKS 20-38]